MDQGEPAAGTGEEVKALLPLRVLGLGGVRSITDDSTEGTGIVFASLACAGLFLAAMAQALAGHQLLSFPTS